MSIGKDTLKNDIITILNGMKTNTGDQQEAINSFADQLSDKVSDAIKRGIDTATIAQTQTAGGYPVTGVLTITATK